MISSSGVPRCDSLRHKEGVIPARHVVTISDRPEETGYEVCDSCLLEYVEKTYLGSAYLNSLPFRVRRL